MKRDERLLRITLIESMILEEEKKLAGYSQCIDKITLLQELLEQEACLMREGDALTSGKNSAK